MVRLVSRMDRGSSPAQQKVVGRQPRKVSFPVANRWQDEARRGLANERVAGDAFKEAA